MQPITHISINIGPTVGGDDAIVALRVAPDGRDGNTVHGRTLNSGEPDSGQAIVLETGEELVFLPSSVKVTIADVETYIAQEPTRNTTSNFVWSWCNVPPQPDPDFFNYVFAMARRIDRAEAIHSSIMADMDMTADEAFVRNRARTFGILGDVEIMCIAMNRAVEMVRRAAGVIFATTPVPPEVDGIHEALLAIRNAFEHIDERAIGKAFREGPVDARSIFNQQSLIQTGTVHYAGQSLDLKVDLPPVLLAARRFVRDVVAEAGTTKTLSGRPIKFGPLAE